MSDLHYLPAQKVDRSFPERLTIRGDDVDILCELLKLVVDSSDDVENFEFDFIERVLVATGRLKA